MIRIPYGLKSIVEIGGVAVIHQPRSYVTSRIEARAALAGVSLMVEHPFNRDEERFLLTKDNKSVTFSISGLEMVANDLQHLNIIADERFDVALNELR